MAAGDKIKWDEANFLWNDAVAGNIYTWDDVKFLDDIISGVASGEEILTVVEKLKPEKKKRFIKLVCKVKGIETYSGQKTIHDDIKVSAKDVELVVKEILGIDLTVENINAR